MKKNIGTFLYSALVIVVLWGSISTTIQSFKCPPMTKTELFLNVHKSIVLDWNDCKQLN